MNHTFLRTTPSLEKGLLLVARDLDLSGINFQISRLFISGRRQGCQTTQCLAEIELSLFSEKALRAEKHSRKKFCTAPLSTFFLFRAGFKMQFFKAFFFSFLGDCLLVLPGDSNVLNFAPFFLDCPATFSFSARLFHWVR